MATKRSIVLQGCPNVNEDGAASAEVRPGYLVKGVTTIAHQTVNGTAVPVAVALERDELGQGIDNARQGSGTASAYYASGDTVKVGVFKAGEVFTGFIASGQNVAADALLGSAGDGTLKTGATVPLVRSLDAPGAVTVTTAIRVQVI